jgi:hypothetical protein
MKMKWKLLILFILVSVFLLSVINLDGLIASQEKSYPENSKNIEESKEELEGEPIVFILSGQSNMVGYGTPDNLIEKNLLAISDNVDFYYVDSSDYSLRMIDSIEDEKYSNEVRFGPEISLIHKLAEDYPNQKVIIIKFGVGGSSISNWSPGVNYYELIRHIRTVVQDYSIVEYGGLFWFQGEDDTRPLNEDYLSMTKEMFEQVRIDLNASDMPFFMGKIHPGTGDCPWANDTIIENIVQVREWQGQMESEMEKVYVTDGQGLSCFDNDAIHFNTESLVELGYLFGDVYDDYLTDVSNSDASLVSIII